MSPTRIQRKRTKGWRKPEGAVIVTHPTQWQNPHRPKVRTPEANAEAVRLFREDLLAGRLKITVADVQRELRGRDLCCYCKPELPCHADVLIEVANR